MEPPTIPLETQEKNKTFEEKRRERQGPFITELEDTLETLDEEMFMSLLEKYKSTFPKKDSDKMTLFEKFYGLLHSRKFKKLSEEKKKSVSKLIEELKLIVYDTLFPLKESYTVKEFQKEFTRNKKASSNLYKKRFNHYLNHTSFNTLTEGEKQDFLNGIYKKDLHTFFSTKQESTLHNLLESAESKTLRKSIQYPTHSEKVDSLPENVPIYYYGGHGRDECDPFTHKLQEDIVPENCIYITTGLCGQTTQFNKELIELFRENSEHSRLLLRYPYLFQNLQELSKRLNIPLDSFHFHFPGDKYIVSHFNPFQTWLRDDLFFLVLSGLCEKRDMERIPKDSLQFYYIGKDFIKQISKDIFKEETLQTNTILAKLKTIKSIPHNNTLKSFLYKLNAPNAEKYWSEIGKTTPTLTKEEAIKHLEKFFYSVSRGEFLNLFSASSYPKKQLIKKAVFPSLQYISKKEEDEENDLIDEEDIKRASNYIKNNFSHKFSTRTIMKNFPGIHFFTICRSVSKDCEPLAELRRTSSETEEKERRETLVQKIPTQSFQRDLISLTSEKSLQGFINTHKEILGTLEKNEKRKLFKKIIDTYSMNEFLLEAELLYNILFPLKESYLIKEALEALENDNTRLREFNSYPLLTYIQDARANHYMTHLDISSIKTMSNIDKTNLYQELQKYESHISQSNFEQIKKMLTESSPSEYETVEKSIQNVFSKNIVNAKDSGDLMFKKRSAVFDALSSLKLDTLSDEERKKILKMLEKQGIITYNPKTESKMSRKIKHIVWPTRYKQAFGGGTRKKRSKLQTKQTRKH